MQINWLPEYQGAAFIATGKPWMEHGKWYTTQRKTKRKCERGDALSISNISYALVTWARITSTVSL